MKRILWLAFAGSIAHNAGLGVALLYLFTIVLIVLLAIATPFGWASPELAWTTGAVFGASLLMLVAGFLFNRPTE